MKKDHSSLVLTAADIQEIIEAVGLHVIMDELIENLYSAILGFSSENTIIPIRSGFNYLSPNEGLIEWMPLRDIEAEEVSFKMVGYHPSNPKEQQLPTIISNISKYDTRTGHLLALMDGVLPTALRTGAASAIASKLLAHEQSKVIGLIGCGAQSITQLHALRRVFEITKVLYYDIDSPTQDSFKSRAAFTGTEIEFISSTIEDIVRHSDILCTATSIGIGEGPLFQGLTSKSWLHINAVGSDFAGKTELPKQLLVDSFVCPDLLGQAIIEGECQQLAEEQIGDDIFTLIKNASSHKDLKSEKTVFDSTGMALEDQVVADLFISHANRLGIGMHLQLENTLLEEKNPYSFLVKPITNKK